MIRPIGYFNQMEKRLIVVGNSLAFVIDKPLRAKLGITSKTCLSVANDGVRMIIQPIRKERTLATSARGAAPVSVRRPNGIRVLRALEEQGLDKALFLRLTGFDLLMYGGQLDLGIDRTPRLTNLIPLGFVMDRLDACIDVLNTGASWDQAIQAAITAVPSELVETYGTSKVIVDS